MSNEGSIPSPGTMIELSDESLKVAINTAFGLTEEEGLELQQTMEFTLSEAVKNGPVSNAVLIRDINNAFGNETQRAIALYSLGIAIAHIQVRAKMHPES